MTGPAASRVQETLSNHQAGWRLANLGTALGVGFALTPISAEAHSFGRVYNFPVPFWMYIYGASAALVLSFVIAVWVMTRPAPASGHIETQRWRPLPAHGCLRPVIQGLGLLILTLCIVSGLAGNADPYRNFNMTFFWVVFALGVAYACAFAGDIYRPVNPWSAAATLISRFVSGFSAGRLPYPTWLGYWPAVALYIGFVEWELLGHPRPQSLSIALIGYTALNLLGVWLFGAAQWFRHGEFFAVFMRLIGLMAPLTYRDGHWRWRAPMSGLLEERADHWSLLVFILFMLSSTAFDGLIVTRWWFQAFWSDPTGWLAAHFGKPPLLIYPEVMPTYYATQAVALVASPFVYLAMYLTGIAAMRLLAGAPRDERHLALRFTYSLLPIVLVYHITHYGTLLIGQGPQIISLISDPLGRGWNLFGTAGLYRAPFLPKAAWIWHTQVGLILFGHIISVLIAHREALRLYPTRRTAALSQLPMLTLMVIFTALGLWILAQPLQAGR